MSELVDLGGNGDTAKHPQDTNGSLASTSKASTNSPPLNLNSVGDSSLEVQDTSILHLASTSGTSVTTPDYFEDQPLAEYLYGQASGSDVSTEAHSSNAGTFEKFDIRTDSQKENIKLMKYLPWDGDDTDEEEQPEEVAPVIIPQPKLKKVVDRKPINHKVGILLLSHLSQFVNKKDIMKVFSHYGEMKYFKMRNSIIGYYIREQWQTAVLVYKRKRQAITAYRQNRNIEIKGLCIHIELVTSESRLDVQRWACNKIGIDLSIADESSEDDTPMHSDSSGDDDDDDWAKENLKANNKLKNWLKNMAL